MCFPCFLGGKKQVFPIFHRVFNNWGKPGSSFSTIQHFSCGIPRRDFLVFVYFGFIWKLKGIFWNSIIPFVYRGAHRNVENHVENVKNSGFCSPLFHIMGFYPRGFKNCLLNPPRFLCKKNPPRTVENTRKIQQKKSIPRGYPGGFSRVFRGFSTKKSPALQRKPAQNGRNPQPNVVK